MNYKKRISGLIVLILLFIDFTFIVPSNAEVKEIDINFITACKNGNVELADKYIKEGADLNAADAKGQNAFAIAVMNDRPEIVKYLINKKMDPNGLICEKLTKYEIEAINDKDGLSGLSTGDIVDVEMLSQAYKNKDNDQAKISTHDQTYLMYAVKKGMFEMVKVLIENGADKDKVSNLGYTALAYGWAYDNEEIMKLLIDKGKGLKGENRTIALIYAASKGYIDILGEMLKKGFDPNVKYFLPERLHHEHFEYMVSSVLKKMKYRSRYSEFTVTPLIAAIVENRLQAVKTIVKKGANVEIGRGLNTPLFISIMFGRLEITKFLLDKGANVNVKGELGETPLIYATYLSDYETVKLLIERGAAINYSFIEGMSAPILSLSSTDPRIVKLFIDKGFDIKKIINSKIDNQWVNWSGTPVLQAVKYDNNPMVKYLIELGADVNKEVYSNTPIIQAIYKGNYENVKLLIDAGARLDKNCTLNAINSINVEILKLLMEKELTNNLSDSKSENLEGNKEIAKFLFELGIKPKMDYFFKPWNHKEFPKNLRKIIVELLPKEKFGQYSEPENIQCAPPAAGENIDAKDNEGNTALLYLIKSYPSALKLIKFIIDNKADINAKNKSGEYPLLVSIDRGNREIFELLLKHGAVLDYDEKIIGEKIIEKIKSNSKPELVGRYIEYAGIKNITLKGDRKMMEHILLNTYIAKAKNIFENNQLNFDTSDTESVKLCFENEIENNCSYINSEIVISNGIFLAGRLKIDPNELYKMIQNKIKYIGDEEIAKLSITAENRDFLRYLIDKNQTDEVLHLNVISELLKNKNTEMLDFYAQKIIDLRSAWGTQLLYKLIEFKKNDEFIKYYKSGAGENDTKRNINELLLNAIENNLETIVKYLVDQGADLKACRYAEAALSNGNIKLSEYLVSKGAEIKELFEPLNVSIRDGNTELFEYLLPIINEKDINHVHRWSDAVDMAIVRGNITALKKLIARGARLKPVLNSEGDYTISGGFSELKVIGRHKDDIKENTSYLNFAIDENYREAAVVLAEYDPEINKPGTKGRCALELAIEKKYTDVALAILKRPDLDMSSAGIKSSFSKALTTGNTDVIKAMIEKGYNYCPDFSPEALKKLSKNGCGASQAIMYSMIKKSISTDEIIIKHSKIGISINEMLINSLKLNNEEFAKYLLKNDINVNYKDYDGRTPMVCAAEKDLRSIVRMLLEKGADPNSKDPYQRPLIVVAAFANNFELLKLFIDHGADVNASTPFGMTALYASILMKNTEILKYLIERKFDLSNTLIKAVKEFNYEAVKFLLDNGANPNVCDSKGINAVKIAAEMYQYEIEEMLVKKGADPNFESKAKELSDLFGMIKYGRFQMMLQKLSSEEVESKIISILNSLHDINIKNEDGDTLLITALNNYEMKKVALELIKKGADLNLCGANGMTPLMLLLDKGYEIDDAWLDNIKNVNSTNAEGKNALFYCRNVKIDAIEKLIKKGADVNLKDNSGNTPLIYVIESNHGFDCALKLIKSGADVKAKNSDGMNALMFAVKIDRSSIYLKDQEYVELIKKLSNNGVYINERDCEGNTALHHALNRNNPLAVKTLLALGADIKIKNLKHETPLLICVSWGWNTESSIMLINAGANIDIGDQGFYDAGTLSQLYYCRDQKIIDILIDKNIKYIKDFNENLIKAFENYDTEKYISTIVKIAKSKKINTEKLWDLFLKKFKIDDPDLVLSIIHSGSNELIRFLKSKDFKFNVKNRSAVDIADYAIRAENYEVISFLLDENKNLDDGKYREILDLPFNSGNKDAIKYLIKNIRPLEKKYYDNALKRFKMDDDTEGVEMVLNNDTYNNFKFEKFDENITQMNEIKKVVTNSLLKTSPAGVVFTIIEKLTMRKISKQKK